MDSSITMSMREPKTPIRRGQRQLSLRVYLHHELISHLQGRVNPHAEENPLYKLQHWSNSTENTTYYDVPLPAVRQTHHIFNIKATPRTFTVTCS